MNSTKKYQTTGQAEKSEGHIMFFAGHEYYLVNDQLYRAPESNPVLTQVTDWGRKKLRCGRWQMPLHLAESFLIDVVSVE